MDIKTFVSCAKALPADISVMLRGAHGIGKSEVVAQLSKHFELPLIDRRMSQTTEGDILGLPRLDDGITRFAPPEFIARACREPVLLFLDEVNRATPEVMQAVFQIALDRCDFAGNRLHPATRVYVAVNNGGSYQVNEMDPAFLDRFFVAELQPTPQDWLDWAEGEGKIHPDLVRFLKERQTRLDPSDANPGTVQPSRRSWARLDRIYRANSIYDQDLREDAGTKGRAYSLAIGVVGVEAANDLADYLSTRETRYKATDILDSYPKHQRKIRELGQDKLIALTDDIVEHAKDNLFTTAQAKNIGLYVGDLPAELRVGFLVRFAKETRQKETFIPNFQKINPEIMPTLLPVFNDKATEADGEKADSKDAKKTKKAKK